MSINFDQGGMPKGADEEPLPYRMHTLDDPEDEPADLDAVEVPRQLYESIAEVDEDRASSARIQSEPYRRRATPASAASGGESADLADLEELRELLRETES